MCLPRMRGDPPIPASKELHQAWSTPHAQGSTLAPSHRVCDHIVYPACAGIHHLISQRARSSICLPRMRGDPPSINLVELVSEMSTPHARGSTVRTPYVLLLPYVYPACAGIHPTSAVWEYLVACLPRMRGDPPVAVPVESYVLPSTPHARGSTPTGEAGCSYCGVYPACAGIHLIWNMIHESPTGLPRMRGDPPMAIVSVKLSILSTPHARGSTFRGKRDDL